MSEDLNLLTFPQVFEYLYDKKVAVAAGIISAVGYIGFTGSQILAGAKLAAATFVDLELKHAVILMGVIAVVYTVMGGLKAVIYTDTVQWAILMFGLIFIGIPTAYTAIGGYDAVVKQVDAEAMLSFSNVSWSELVNWAVTIVPIWFVGMTLYQRIYATRSAKQAKKAWFIAGLLEWPVMAIMGVLLGLFAKVAYDQNMFEPLGFGAGVAIDEEMGLPMLLRTVLPVGLMGLMMSAYFSAIMSTADSCLMAASGNVVTDLVERVFKISEGRVLRISQWATLVIGAFAIAIAYRLTSVIDLMLDSYAFMVSGLFVPVLGAFFWKKSSSWGALIAMIAGGTTTLTITRMDWAMPYGLDANIAGISMSLILFIFLSFLIPDKNRNENKLRYT
jgi:SSS family solute:Na+ symporter